MAGKLPSFLNGSAVLIKIGDVYVAYCQDLRFSRNMANVPVRGIGSYSVHTLEPVDFTASGTMSIVRYTSDSFRLLKDENIYEKDSAQNIVMENGQPKVAPAVRTNTPANLASAQMDKNRDGNSLLSPYAFDPRRLLLSETFDIDVYQRGADNNTGVFGAMATKAETSHIFQFKDCRLTGYSFSFVPGQLLTENVSFVCMQIIDKETIGD